MPKLVDPVARRQEVVDAVFRVAVRDGLQHASLRKSPTRRSSTGERRTVATDLLEQLLPLDDARRAEVTVWLELTTAARTDPGLFDLAAEAGAGTQVLVRRILSRHAEAGHCALIWICLPRWFGWPR